MFDSNPVEHVFFVFQGSLGVVWGVVNPECGRRSKTMKGEFVMADEMTKIEIITRQSKLEELKEALNNVGINGMTVYNVLGYGTQKGQKHKYRGVEYSVDLLPKVKIEMVVCSVPVDAVVDAAIKVLRTGQVGDGKIFISPVSKVIKVRTGETDKKALI